VKFEGPKLVTREGGGSEWEPIKILLEGDGNSNKMNTASKARLRLNYPSWPRSRNHWSATGPRNEQPPKLTRERSGKNNSSNYSHIWEGNKREKNHEGFMHTSPTKSQRERSQNRHKKFAKKRLQKSPKRENGKNTIKP
jgi:hypothetical protein